MGDNISTGGLALPHHCVAVSLWYCGCYKHNLLLWLSPDYGQWGGSRGDSRVRVARSRSVVGVHFVHGLPIPGRIGRLCPLDRGNTTTGTTESTRVTGIFGNRDSGFLLIVNPYSTSERRDILSCIRHLTEIRRRIGSGVVVVPEVCANGPQAANTNCGNVVRRPSPSNIPSVCTKVLTIHSVRSGTVRRANLSTTSRVLCPTGCECLSSLLSCITINTHDIRGRSRHLTTDNVSIPYKVGGNADNSCSIVLGTVATTRDNRAFVCHN